MRFISLLIASLCLFLILDSSAQDKPASFDIELRIQAGHQKAIQIIKFSPSGRYLASGGAGIIIIWDLLSRMEIDRIRVDKQAVIEQFRFSQDNKMLYIGTSWNAGSVICYDLVEGKKVKTVSANSMAGVGALAIDPSQEIVAFGGKGGNARVRIKNLKSGKKIADCYELNGSVSDPLLILPNGKGIIACKEFALGDGPVLNPLKNARMIHINVQSGIMEFDYDITKKRHPQHLISGSQDGGEFFLLTSGHWMSDKEVFNLERYKVGLKKPIKKIEFEADDWIVPIVANGDMYFSQHRVLKKVDLGSFEVMPTGLNIENIHRFDICEERNWVATVDYDDPNYISIHDLTTKKKLFDLKNSEYGVTRMSYVNLSNKLWLSQKNGDKGSRICSMDLKSFSISGAKYFFDESVEYFYVNPNGKDMYVHTTKIIGILSERVITSKLYHVDLGNGTQTLLADVSGKFKSTGTKNKFHSLFPNGTYHTFKGKKEVFSCVIDTSSIAMSNLAFTAFDVDERRRQLYISMTADDGWYTTNDPFVLFKYDIASGDAIILQKNTAPKGEGHGMAIACIKFNERTDELITGGWANNLMVRTNNVVWASQAAKIKYCLEGFSTASTHEYILSENKEYLMSLNYTTGGGSVSTWDLKNGANINNHAEGKVINGIAFADNSRLQLILDGDGKIAFKDRKSGQLIGTLVSFLEGDNFIFFTPDGYYTGTKLATRKVGIKIGTKSLPFDQFSASMNRPDIIAQRLYPLNTCLSDLYKKIYKRRIKRNAGFDVAKLNIATLPHLSITNRDQIPLLVEDGTLMLKFEAKYSSLLAQLKIKINDVAIATPELNAKIKGQTEFSEDLVLPLNQGDNIISIILEAEDGTQSLMKYLTIKCDKQVTKPTLHALLIGVSKYDNAEYNLTYPSKDITDVKNFISQGSEVFGDIQIRTYIDSEFTKEKLNAFAKEIKDGSEDDQVLIYYAGHGVLDENFNYYLGTSTMNFFNPSENGLSFSAIEDAVKGSKIRNRLIVIDACHSGGVDAEDYKQEAMKTEVGGEMLAFRGFKKIAEKDQFCELSTTSVMNNMFNKPSTEHGATIIAAAAGAEFALESDEWENGIFTLVFLKGLRSGAADLNGDGMIRISELRKYCNSQVVEMTGGRQNPTARDENVRNDFVIWKN